MAAATSSKTKDSASKSKAVAAPKSAAHPTYEDMVKSAILTLKDRKGSSRQAIKKYIFSNFQNLGDQYEAMITAAIKRGVDKGVFNFPKGPSGTVKLTKPTKAEPTEVKPTTPKKKSAAPAPKVTAKAATAKTAPKKPTTTKTTAPKSSAITRKAAPKKAKAVKKPVAKKTAAVKTKIATAKKASPKRKAATKKA